GDVSHELRTPLSVVRGEAELALRKERSPEEYKQALRNISSESQQMTAIVEDLLLLARAQSRNMALRLEEIDTEKFLFEVEGAAKKVFTDREVNLKIAQNGPINFFGAPNYLQLAITNLLANAAKHSPKGSEVQLTVTTN